MSTKEPMIFACHADDERSQREHAFWYRFGTGVLWFTFKKPEDVPAVCDCGNKFVIPAEQSTPEATRAVGEFRAAQGDPTS